MARSPYDVLGVARSADEAAITQAYRALAKKHHPDMHRGDKASEEKFKEISGAYDILGDKAKRARFDRGEIDDQGRERGFGSGFGPRPAGNGARSRPGAAGAPGSFSVDDILSELFGQRGAGGKATAGSTVQGEDLRLAMDVELRDVAQGTVKRIALPEGETVDVTIPAGIESGRILRLKGKGQPGPFGGPPGDALVEIKIRPDERFQRDGLDIASDVPVPLEVAVLGGKVRVPTLDGEVTLTVPRCASSGRVLRLRGKGLKDGRTGKSGDQLARLMIEVPAEDAALEVWARSRSSVTA